MIWFLVIMTALCTVAFLFAPLLTGNTPSKARPLLAGLAAASMAAIIGIYSQIGHPDLTRPVAKPVEPSLATTPSAGHELVSKLKTRLLQTNSEDPEGWRLLARSQMQIGQFDEAFMSYQTLLKITDNDPAIRAEFDQAQSFAQRQAVAAQAQTMTPEDRQAMIQGMVDGLAERLYADGGSAEDWAKLLRARKVLGQDALLAEDIERMKKQFEDRPDVVAQLLGTDQ